jgi:hypothetical protein
MKSCKNYKKLLHRNFKQVNKNNANYELNDFEWEKQLKIKPQRTQGFAKDLFLAISLRFLGDLGG